MVAPDNFNKQPDDLKPTETVMAHQVQLAQEIEDTDLSKKATEQVVEKPVDPPKESQPTSTLTTPKNKGCEEYRSEISKYDWDVNLMMAIMKAESGCRTNAVGDDYPIRGVHAVSCGLFQVRSIGTRPSCSALKDPATNIAWAYRIYQGQGLKAWSVYTNGKYKTHL